ncbi:hypothetical protein QEJ31_15135 [Pigmentibacter sp. JX0631]|uniref:hypothetical protein n=1 Tax=Pigmentibacter sp. JX0631 TaxID=2976982 RepID=UPI0024682B52|nr:hypothetical protein [Pigmentibacter sp. JX0631]WGL59864.1 hypothetical protein QEJ31_15135 [Pigmentibacter sp. JX0631]
MQKSKIFIFYFSILLTTLLLTSCNSNPSNSSKNSSNISKKMLVLYASDDPLWLPYFSNVITRRIQRESTYSAFEDLEINKEWLLNSIGTLKEVHVEDKLNSFSEKLRAVYLAGKYLKAYKLSHQYMQEAAFLLANQPASVGLAYATLSFWASVSNMKYAKYYAIKYGIIYEKYLPLRIKDELEYQANTELIDQLKDLTKSYISSQKYVHIKNIKNCNVYVDGQELKTNKVLLPPKMFSIVTASCANGLFSQTITAEKVKEIRISPYYPAAFYKMPATNALPNELLAQLKLSYILLVFWSHSGKYLDIQIIDAKLRLTVAKTRIDLSSKKNVDEAGDLLLSFLQSNSTNLTKK